MLFAFVPFFGLAPQQSEPSAYAPARTRALPLLPQPNRYDRALVAAQKPATLSSSMGEFAGYFTTGVNRTLAYITSSLTALGSRANAMFATISAALALDRATRDTMSSFGYKNAYAPAPSPYGLDAFWPKPALARPHNTIGNPFDPLAITDHFSNFNPWVAFSKGLAAFCDFGAPQSYRPSPYDRSPTPPQTMTLSVPALFPGLSWGFTWNPQAQR